MASTILISIVIIFSFVKCKNESDRPALSTHLLRGGFSHPETARINMLDTVIKITDTFMRQNFANNTAIDVAKILMELDDASSSGLEILREGATVGNGNEVFTYDTAYHISATDFTGIIVSYWLGPSDLNGHCFRPTTALVIERSNRQRAVKLDFLPTSQSIDSVVGSTLYEFDYECGGRGKTQNFKISLK